MGNKTLDDIFNELEEKYSGNRGLINNSARGQNTKEINSSGLNGLLEKSRNKISELYTGKNIILKLNGEILDIKDINFELDKTLFCHDYLKLTFTIPSEELDKYYGYVFTLNNTLEIELINNDEKFKKIFHTFNIENINIEESMGERAVVLINTPSATFQMSKITKFRSFQSLELTYREIAEAVIADYPDITLYLGNEFDRNIQKIYIQYNENDWDFLVRICKDMGIPMASHLDEIIMGNEINLEIYNAELDNAVYGRGREGENIIFKVREAATPYNTGERVKITLKNQGSQGEDGTDTRIVSKALLRMKDNYVVNDYELIEISHEFEALKNSVGYIIEGKVLKIGGTDGIATMTVDFSHGLEKSAEKKSQAYEDEYAGSHNFPYCTEYSSSNSGMFCSPEKGDIVTIYVPQNNENFSYVTGAVNNPGSERFSNPNIRNYTLSGDDSAGGAPMFNFQLNSKVFSVNTTDFIGLNSKNNMIMNTTNANMTAENYTANTKNITEISSGVKSTIAKEISQVSSGKTVATSGGIYNINGGGNVIINK